MKYILFITRIIHYYTLTNPIVKYVKYAEIVEFFHPWDTEILLYIFSQI